MKKEIKLNIDEIISEYKNGSGVTILASKYHVGKLKIKKILKDNNIELKKRGGQSLDKNYLINDWSIEKYPQEDGYEYIAKSKDGKYETKDYMNNGGYLTSYIKEVYCVEIPSLYDRREYYKLTGNYWWEQWFNIVKQIKKPTKKCPYCDWETIDITNKSGVFEQHLKEKHSKSKLDYLKEYPNDGQYFTLVNPSLNRMFEKDKTKYVVCAICNRKMARISSEHLATHNISKLEYIQKYSPKTTSDEYHNKMSVIAIKGNINIKKSYESKDEIELRNYVRKTLNIYCRKDRKLLEGTELDIYIPNYNLAIEYDGLYWHTESRGKDCKYHLNKTERLNEKNIGLIHVFEDEYKLHKDIVFSKIKHILKQDMKLPKIMGRKCIIKEIDKTTSSLFLDKFHIQGAVNATVYLGAYYNGALIGVMTFLRECGDAWNLTRFATDYNFRMQGVGGKIFKYFIKKYIPSEIKSFADRRWTTNPNNNLYIHLGFKLAEIIRPEYRYYKPSIDRFKRFHKFGFRKQILHKKYGLPLTMTEKEMTQKLGYERIWDCGLFKYAWQNPDYNKC